MKKRCHASAVGAAEAWQLVFGWEKWAEIHRIAQGGCLSGNIQVTTALVSHFFPRNRKMESTRE